MKLIGVSRIDELPPLPPNARPNTLVQPKGVPVPIFEMISDEMVARGATANSGTASAIVFRNSHDTGFGNVNKSTQGNFVGNLLHLGNGFPVDGGEINGYDLLVYNSVSSPGGDAACTVSLWDGDPLGIIDTRINDPPQQIPQTLCTFSGMEQAGLGTFCDVGGTDLCVGGFLDGTSCANDTDCGLCPAIQGDDIPECPGLFRLVCDFEKKVLIASRNVWMVIEWTSGCRMGWRWAFHEGPEIAAVGEENFCAGTCPASLLPCVDLAIELVDGASQWSGIGVGTCCEDDTIQCDHSDGTLECGHATSCSDGVATDFSGWCFGAPTYFASFVASIYANTDTTVTLVPVGASGTHTIVGNEIILQEGVRKVWLEVRIGDWDPLDTGVKLKRYRAHMDWWSYGSGTQGRVGPAYDVECTDHSDCEKAYANGALCMYRAPFRCWPGLIDTSRTDYVFSGVDNMAYVDFDGRLAFKAYAWPGDGVDDPEPFPAEGFYGGTLVLYVSPNAQGTFTLGMESLLDFSALIDQNNQLIPLLGLVPALIHIDCNGNGILDGQDLAGGSSNDCNGNDIPDECETGGIEDCNANGTVDLCDIEAGTSADCSIVLDHSCCESHNGPGCSDPDIKACVCALNPYCCSPTNWWDSDCAGSVAEYGCDLCSGGNGVPDECESDCNLNGVADSCDIAAGISEDCNVLPHNCCEIDHGSGCSDPGIRICVCWQDPYCCDNDWDSVCVQEVMDFGCSVCSLFNGNGIPDECEPDCNENGITDSCELADGTREDCNGNAIPDECDLTGGASQDCNGNAIPDECDPDCNQNGTPDACDIADGTSQDVNNDGIPDECEECFSDGDCDDANPCNGAETCDALGQCHPGTITDCNDNDVDDSCDLAEGTSADDCNGNAIPDECDLTGGASQDCNGNAIPDECDITSGTLTDLDMNGVPDECGACCDTASCTQTLAAPCDAPATYLGDQTICEQDCASNVPAVSDWGLITMTLLMLSTARVIRRTQRNTRCQEDS